MKFKLYFHQTQKLTFSEKLYWHQLLGNNFSDKLSLLISKKSVRQFSISPTLFSAVSTNIVRWFGDFSDWRIALYR